MKMTKQTKWKMNERQIDLIYNALNLAEVALDMNWTRNLSNEEENEIIKKDYDETMELGMFLTYTYYKENYYTFDMYLGDNDYYDTLGDGLVLELLELDNNKQDQEFIDSVKELMKEPSESKH